MNMPGLNFQLGEDIDALRDAVREFAQAEIAPRAAEIDRTDQFPIIHVDKGGSIGGVIAALNWIVDMSVPEYRAEGGTLIVPGHGRVSDVSDVAYYRDMLTIIRDRIVDQKSKGRTLDEVINSLPSFDYDSRYGRDQKSINQFIEAVYLTI